MPSYEEECKFLSKILSSAVDIELDNKEIIALNDAFKNLEENKLLKSKAEAELEKAKNSEYKKYKQLYDSKNEEKIKSSNSTIPNQFLDVNSEQVPKIIEDPDSRRKLTKRKSTLKHQEPTNENNSVENAGNLEKENDNEKNYLLSKDNQIEEIIFSDEDK